MSARRPAIRALAASALVLVLLGGCKSEGPAATGAGNAEVKAAAERAGTPSARTLRDISVLARGQAIDDDDADEAADELAQGSTTLEAFVDAQLADEEFAKRIAASLIFGRPISVKERHPVPTHSVLKTAVVDGRKVHYLRKPCALADAVEVDPWWDPGDEIRVCPDAYRPDVRGDADGRTCGASMLSPYGSETCGCGPRLMFCALDKKHNRKLRASLMQEVNRTVRHVAEGNGPIDALFTANETFRNRDVEFVYRRARVAAGEDPALLDMDDFDGDFRRAPRHEQVPGQHAGILTAPALVYGSDALRGVMRNYYQFLWCAEPARSKVSTEAVMKLGKVDLRVGDGWKQLASMDICTDCHARLDYGMQFFKGYPSSVNGIDFRPTQALSGKGPLYGNDIGDARGEAELTPSGFAKLVLAQDEFGQCMTRRVIDHVFGDGARADDFDAVESAFRKTRNLKQMMRVALVRFAARPPSTVAVEPLPEAPAVPADAAQIAVGEPLRRFLDNHCAECHDEGDPHPFHEDTLPRSTIAEMLELVAFGAMPATPRGVDDGERRRFVDLLVPTLWSDAKQRAAARRYYADALRAYPVHRFTPAMKMVARHAGGEKVPGLRVVERAIQQSQARYSPGFATATGLTALTTCKDEGKSGDALAACVREATRPAHVILGQPPSGRTP